MALFINPNQLDHGAVTDAVRDQMLSVLDQHGWVGFCGILRANPDNPKQAISSVGTNLHGISNLGAIKQLLESFLVKIEDAIEEQEKNAALLEAKEQELEEDG